jgi:hypothetical protein
VYVAEEDLGADADKDAGGAAPTSRARAASVGGMRARRREESCVQFVAYARVTVRRRSD